MLRDDVGLLNSDNGDMLTVGMFQMLSRVV